LDFINEEQIRRNQDSRAGWELYTEHRQTVTFLLTQNLPTQMGRLCLLGAGNCNDVDLKQLRSFFSEIHLVDLDVEALQVGCQAQGMDEDTGIVYHGGIDVTGILPLIDGWRPDKPTPENLVTTALQVAARTNLFGLPAGTFDVVASTGLLTQLIDQLSLTLGTQHPRFVNLMTQVRMQHLLLMLELLKPKGISWLFTEIVSSLTCPELLTVAPADLMPLVTSCINQTNFFTGCNPAVINQLYQRDPVLKASVQNVFVSRPWLWKYIHRLYAVCAVGAIKRSPPQLDSNQLGSAHQRLWEPDGEPSGVSPGIRHGRISGQTPWDSTREA
jgi:hypothetical protein